MLTSEPKSCGLERKLKPPLRLPWCCRVGPPEVGDSCGKFIAWPSGSDIAAKGMEPTEWRCSAAGPNGERGSAMMSKLHHQKLIFEQVSFNTTKK